VLGPAIICSDSSSRLRAAGVGGSGRHRLGNSAATVRCGLRESMQTADWVPSRSWPSDWASTSMRRQMTRAEGAALRRLLLPGLAVAVDAILG